MCKAFTFISIYDTGARASSWRGRNAVLQKRLVSVFGQEPESLLSYEARALFACSTILE
jgi:hypothetical protein